MEANLTSKEIDTLVEALEVWERKDFAGQLMGVMFRGMLGKDMTTEQKIEMEEEEKRKNEEIECETKKRKETALLLKAKLVMMKQDRAIQSAIHA